MFSTLLCNLHNRHFWLPYHVVGTVRICLRSLKVRATQLHCLLMPIALRVSWPFLPWPVGWLLTAQGPVQVPALSGGLPPQAQAGMPRRYCGRGSRSPQYSTHGNKASQTDLVSQCLRVMFTMYISQYFSAKKCQPSWAVSTLWQSRITITNSVVSELGSPQRSRGSLPQGSAWAECLFHSRQSA